MTNALRHRGRRLACPLLSVADCTGFCSAFLYPLLFIAFSKLVSVVCSVVARQRCVRCCRLPLRQSFVEEVGWRESADFIDNGTRRCGSSSLFSSNAIASENDLTLKWKKWAVWRKNKE